MIETESFRKSDREQIIGAASVDQFRFRWLTEAERAVQSGGRILRTLTMKKEAQDRYG